MNVRSRLDERYLRCWHNNYPPCVGTCQFYIARMHDQAGAVQSIAVGIGRLRTEKHVAGYYLSFYAHVAPNVRRDPCINLGSDWLLTEHMDRQFWRKPHKNCGQFVVLLIKGGIETGCDSLQKFVSMSLHLVTIFKIDAWNLSAFP
jgi:hypothetical protein